MPRTTEHHCKIEWVDAGREPQCAPDPDYPDGKEVDLRKTDSGPYCEVALPYPARRCGMYIVNCVRCKYVAAITTAGRPDDPRKVMLSCKLSVH